MNKKYLYSAVASFAIALNAVPIQAEESIDQNENFSEIAFVCAIQAGTPTMYAYTPGEIDLEPLMSWHSEYLLPEQSGKQICLQTATKLQASVQQDQAKYLKATTLAGKNLVCLVSQEEEECATEGSQTLFNVNPDYEAGCLLDNMKPIECKALRGRGNIYSFDNEPYQLMWWPW